MRRNFVTQSLILFVIVEYIIWKKRTGCYSRMNGLHYHLPTLTNIIIL